jgi:hypothetical protein
VLVFPEERPSAPVGVLGLSAEFSGAYVTTAPKGANFSTLGPKTQQSTGRAEFNALLIALSKSG